MSERLRVREIDDDEGQRLVRIIRRGGGSVVTWRRAQMVFLSAQGMDVPAAARAILLQASVASDLRFLLSVLRVVPELERSHDLVMQIASRAGRIRGDDLSPRGRGLVERTGERASGMWRLAADFLVPA